MKKIVLIIILNVLLLSSLFYFANGEEQIFGGRTSEYKSFMVTIRSKNFFCSGVLVHPRVVLSEGHCFQGGSVNLKVGEYNKSNYDEHEIALTSSAITITKSGLLLIALPYDVRTLTPVSVTNKISVDADVSLFGWGIVDNSFLPDTLQTTEHRFAFSYSNMLCFTDKNEVSRGSPGDSGGAIVQNDKLVSTINVLFRMNERYYTCGTPVYDIEQDIEKLLSAYPVYYSYFPVIRQ